MHERSKGRRNRTARVLGLVAVLAVGALACATPAELRKIQNRVTDLERSGTGGPDRTGLADLRARMTELQRSVDAIEGRIEVVERQSQQAVEEARAARREANSAPTTAPVPDPTVGASPPGEPVSQEVQSYREAYARWRKGDTAGCVDQFGKFLQTYPASDYADDATYWLADCYFKQGNYSAAVLRFDDVARQFPTGDKAPDALYRQGEALLRMGHGTAAGNAFEKVLRDYPESPRAPEAKRQLEILKAG